MVDKSFFGLILYLYYNELVLGSAVKKIFLGGILLGALIYFIGPDQAVKLPLSPQVLGENLKPTVEERILTPAQDIIGRYVRWPNQEDLAPLPQLVTEENNPNLGEQQLENLKFNQSLTTLIEEIKKLPQQQLAQVKEQLIKEIFPNCRCLCE